MHFRFIDQPVGIPTISNRLYLKLGSLGFPRTQIILVVTSDDNLNRTRLIRHNTGISY